MAAVCSRIYRAYLSLWEVANLGHLRYYIQPALNLDTDERGEREKRSLRLIGDSFRRIVIMNKVTKPHVDDDGILTMGLIDFLLNPDSLDSA